MRDAGVRGKIERVLKTDYEEMANVVDEHAEDSADNAHYDRPAVLDLVGELAGLRVLDAGCGPGHYAEVLVARGAEVVAVDGVAAMVELARKRLGKRAEVIQADLNEPLPFGASEFDLVVCALVIHHLEKLRREPGFVVLLLVKP